MIEFMLLLFWLAGWLFTVGIFTDDTKGVDGFLASCLLLVFWPLILGCYLREKLGWRGD